MERGLLWGSPLPGLSLLTPGELGAIRNCLLSVERNVLLVRFIVLAKPLRP